MKAQLRRRGIAVHLLVWLRMAGRTAAEAAISSSSAAEAALLLDDVPGCGCPASTTCGSSFASHSDVAACSLVKRSAPPYVFEGVVNSTSPVCDALESDPAFREIHGVGGQGATPGFLPIEVVTGTCADARAKQESCGGRATASNETATTAEEDSAAYGSLSGSLVGRFMSIPDRCQSSSVEQQVNGVWPGGVSFRSLRVITTCRSEFDEAVSKGHADDALMIYMDMDYDYYEEEEEHWQPPPSSPCGSSRIGELADRRPALTSDDWIEPRGGRRHMCHDFVRGGRPYSMLVVSLGVEPCGGAPADAPASAAFVEASSVGGLVPAARCGAVGFALAAAISLCILC